MMLPCLVFTLMISTIIATPLLSYEDPLDLSIMDSTFLENDRMAETDIEPLISEKSVAGKSYPARFSVSQFLLPIYVRFPTHLIPNIHACYLQDRKSTAITTRAVFRC